MSSLVIGTAGHIDHGKSALVEALTGIDPDRLKEEKARGITIELGFASCRFGDVELAFVDVPGHERFVRTMLAGAGGIDAVLLVVAADEGVKPQTREHFQICRLLGIERGLIALTKSDLTDPETLELAEIEVRDLVAGSFLAGAPIVPVSARTRDGLDALATALAALASGISRPRRESIVRMPIDRAFIVHGFGVVVTGTLVSGGIAVGDALELLPAGRPVRVRGLQIHGERVEAAVAPRRVAVNLSGIALGDVERGGTLATPDTLTVTRRADLRVHLLPDARALKHGARVRVHHGTSDAAAIVSIAARRPAASAPWVPARLGDLGVTVEPAGDAFVRLRLDRPLVLTGGDRVVIRTLSPSATIGGGVVLDPVAAGRGVRRSATAERFQQLDKDEGPRVWLTEAGTRGLDVNTLVRRAGLSPEAAATLVETLCERGQACSVGDRVYDLAAVRRITEFVISTLTAFHAARPSEADHPRETVRTAISPPPAAEVFDAVIRDLVARQAIVGADRLAIATHRATAVADESRIRAVILDALRAAGLSPPGIDELKRALGPGTAGIDRVTQMLVKEGSVVRLEGLLFDATALSALKASMMALRGDVTADSPAMIDVATFKTRFGLSRKYAIPLLEWLDRERVTRRVGERRVLL